MDMQIFAAAQKAAAAYNVPAPWIAAVIAKESGGVVFANVDGQRLPLIRWEGHYFYQRLTGTDLEQAMAKKLAAPKPGAIKNPADQVDRWRTLYRPGCDIDALAAQESTSWGVGQVMGAHWKRLSFASVGDLVMTACSGLDGQVEIMMRYCREFGLLDELARGDALGFARGYNGPKAPKRYADDIERLAKEFGGEVNTAEVAGMLRMGMKGAKVRELQGLLNRSGAALKTDGDYGPATKDAVLVFQRKNGLTPDGIVGPETTRTLSSYRVAPDEAVGKVGAMETPEAKQGTAFAIAGAAGLGALDKVQPYIDQVNAAADKLGSFSSLSSIAGYAATGLTIAAALLVVGGIGWGGLGWIRSKRTEGWA